MVRDGKIYIISGRNIKKIISLLNDLRNVAVEYSHLKDEDSTEVEEIYEDLILSNIINVKSEVKKWLTEKLNVYGIYKHEYYNEKEDFQFKVGLGVKL